MWREHVADTLILTKVSSCVRLCKIHGLCERTHDENQSVKKNIDVRITSVENLFYWKQPALHDS